MRQNCNNCSFYGGDKCTYCPDFVVGVLDPGKKNACEHYLCKHDNGWGGSRQGSGRKPATQDGKRVQVVITIDLETRNKLKSICKARGVKMGRLVDEMVGGEW